jgi:hypothetical protein
LGHRDTKLAAQLEARVLGPRVYHTATGRPAKPLLVVAVTDGEPTDSPRDRIVSVIKTCVKHVGRLGLGPHAVAFQFAQVSGQAGWRVCVRRAPLLSWTRSDSEARCGVLWLPAATSTTTTTPQQVGRDQRAQQFLADLDNHPKVGGVRCGGTQVNPRSCVCTQQAAASSPSPLTRSSTHTPLALHCLDTPTPRRSAA